MANIHVKRFEATEANLANGEPQMSREEIINSIIAYKKQNPVKFAAKKEALFAKYGLNDIPQEVEDDVVKELEAKKKSTKKLNIV